MSKLLFYTLLILLPTQLGKHFWPDFTQVLGIRMDYLSPTIYLTDIILGLLFLTWGLASVKNIKYHPELERSPVQGSPESELCSSSGQKLNIKYFTKSLAIGIFLVFLGLNVIFSKNPAVALYKIFKIFEFVFFGFYIAKKVTTLIQIKKIILILTFCVLYESFIAFAQFLTQSSLTLFYSLTYPRISFGFWLFGERTFNGTTLGIAQAVLDGRIFLRPYATFPHPNALAGFIVVVLTLALGQILNSSHREISSKYKYHPEPERSSVQGSPESELCSSSGHRSNKTKQVLFTFYFLLFTFISVSTLLITFSRSAWGVGALAFIVSFLRRHFKNLRRVPVYSLAFLFLLAVLLVVCDPYIFRALNLRTENGLSLLRRIELGKATLRMVKAYPLFGVGLGNFIVRLNEFSRNRETIYWLQPVHNIFLLVAAETGLVGLGIFLWFLIATYKRLISRRLAINYSLLIALSSVLTLGLFDHYFLTLQQTQLLFSLVLGLCWTRISGSA